MALVTDADWARTHAQTTGATALGDMQTGKRAGRKNSLKEEKKKRDGPASKQNRIKLLAKRRYKNRGGDTKAKKRDEHGSMAWVRRRWGRLNTVYN